MTDPLFGAGIRFADTTAKSGDGLGFLAMARHLPRLVTIALRLGWQSDRRALIGVLVARLTLAPLTMIVILATNRVLEPLLSSVPTEQRVLAALPAIGVLAAAAGLTAVLVALGNAAQAGLAPKVQRAAQTRLMESSLQVELADAEGSEFHDLMAAARRGAGAASQVIESALGVVQALTGLIAAGGALAVLKPVLIPFLVAAVIPKGWATVRAARARFVSTKKHTQLVRQVDMVASLTLHPMSAVEIRAHRLADFLLSHFRRLSELTEAERQRLAWQEARAGLVAGAMSGLGLAAVYTALLLLVVNGAVPLAAAGAAVFAIGVGLIRLTALISQTNGVYEQGLFLLDWERAVQHADRHHMRTDGSSPDLAPELIVAREVGFRYPDAPRQAVVRADMRLRRGEIIALVGENGSGKSTMAKLLAGLYLPESGTITWDGADIELLDRRAVFDRVALVPQDFMNWPFAARVNVGIGRPDRELTDERLAAAAAASGADDVISRLPHGWETLLAREFLGGTALSGGQWQRVGLARALFRDADVLIFDEPTAALDPVAEIEVFDRVAELAAEGRAVVLVTHRMASVRSADRIYVLHEGEVVETGTHDELVALSGRYAAMYQVQAAQFA